MKKIYENPDCILCRVQSGIIAASEAEQTEGNPGLFEEINW